MENVETRGRLEGQLCVQCHVSTFQGLCESTIVCKLRKDMTCEICCVPEAM